MTDHLSAGEQFQVAAISPELVPTAEALSRLRRVAAGTEPGDTIVRGGTMVSLHTGELLERDIVVAGAHIAAITPVGRFDADDEIDAGGLHVVPTFIDSHMHMEYSMLTPGELARLTVPRGTGTILADPLCIANVLGGLGLDIAAATGTPLRIFQQVSFQVPRSPTLEVGGAKIPIEEVLDRVGRSNAVAIGEGNPFDLDDASARKQHHALAAGRRVVGHTARLSDEELWSYVAGGVGDDHNAFDTGEVLERLRLGLLITVMSGSMNDNCPLVFADVDPLRDAFGQFAFCADDRHVGDLARQGHIDHHVRQAIAHGVPPSAAYRMASLNPAQHYRIDHLIGSLTPTRLADLQLIGDLAEARPELVMMGGEVVGRDGVALFDNDDVLPDATRDTVRLSPALSAWSFRVEADAAADEVAVVRASEMYDGYFKRAFEAELGVVDGSVCADPEHDVLKVSIVDRHHGRELLGTGFVRGFGLRSGAMATSTNCENMNLVVLGATDDEMAFAAREVERMGGGMVVVDGQNVLASCALAHAGVMSEQPWETVLDDLDRVEAAAQSLGCTTPSPFMVLNFVGLPVVPDYGLTELGLIDAATQTFVPVVVCCRCPAHVDRHPRTERSADVAPGVGGGLAPSQPPCADGQ